MRVAFLVFYFSVLVVALVTEGEGTDIPRDECIVWSNIDDERVLKTFTDGLDVLLSDSLTVTSEVVVTYSNCLECKLKIENKQNSWVKNKIEMANNISNPRCPNSEPTGQCEINNQQSTNITLKTVQIKGLSVVDCSDGPAVFMVSKHISEDFMLIPWYDGSINLEMTPLADTTIEIKIDGQSYEINGTKETNIYVKVSKTKIQKNDETIGNFTIKEGEEVKIVKNNVPVIIRQSFGSPAREYQNKGPAASLWVYAGIPAAGLVGLIIGALLQYYCQSPKKTSAVHQAAAPTEPGVVSVENDMYEPLEQYRSCTGSGHTAAGSGPVRNDEGRHEVINTLYEPLDEVRARSRQEN